MIKLNEKQTGVVTREIEEIKTQKKSINHYYESINNNKDVLNKNCETNKTLCIYKSTKLNTLMKKTLKVKSNLNEYEKMIDKASSRTE